MNHYQIKFASLFILCLLGNLRSLPAQTPAPAIENQFQLMLSDKTTATAIILPTTNGQLYLVYAASNGKIGLYLISPKLSPDIIPPQPQPNPTPQKLTIGIVENPRETTLEEKTVLVDKAWRDLVAEKHTFVGVIPSDIKETKTGLPPATLLPFLNAAKGRAFPCIVIFDEHMSILYSGKIPLTPQEMTALIHKYGG